MKRYLYGGLTLLALAAVVGIGSKTVAATGGRVAPRFEVDPFWPKPLPNHWRIGMTIGLLERPRDTSQQSALRDARRR